MTKRKRKRQQQEPESPVAAFLGRHPKLLRRLGIAGGLMVAAAALWFLVDPLAAPPTAIGENGEEVSVGLTSWEGPNAGVDGLPSNFVLPDFDNEAVRLDQFQGKTVFINFWATWCGPCREEMPNIIQIAEDFPDDVVVLAINRGESKNQAQDWVRALNFREDLPNFYWLHDDDEPVWRAYREGNSMPQSYFLSADGEIRTGTSGGLNYDEMLSRVERAQGFGGNFNVD